MTNEELQQKYRLLKLVSESGERVYHALDADGHIVMVHYLPGTSPETERLLALLDALGPVDKARIVERVEVDGAPVLVTQFIQSFKTLGAWLQSRTQRPRSAATPPGPTHSPGAMTQMFGPPSADKVSPAPEPTPAPEPPRRAAASTERGPGEITAMFGPSGGSSPPIPPAHAPPPPPEPPRKPAPSAERSPGEFTGLFGAASTPSPASPPPASPPPDPTVRPVDPPAPPPGDKPSVRWRETAPDADRSERPVVRWKKESPLDEPPAQRVPPPPPPGRSKPAGEFTRLFGPSGHGPADSAAPPAGPPSPAAPDPWALDRGMGPPAESAPPSPPRSPGEFTRMFQPEKRPGGPPPIPSQQGPRDYLQALNSPAAPTTPPASFVPPTPQPPGPGAAKPPGEFTRLMSGMPAAGAPPGAPRANPPANVSGGPSDFTRIVAAASAAPRPASPSPDPAPEEEPPKRRSPRLVLLLIALGVVGVLAIAVVLYFVLKTP